MSVWEMLVLEAKALLSVVATRFGGADDVLELAFCDAGLELDVLEGVAAVTEGHRLRAGSDGELWLVLLVLHCEQIIVMYKRLRNAK